MYMVQSTWYRVHGTEYMVQRAGPVRTSRLPEELSIEFYTIFVLDITEGIIEPLMYTCILLTP